MCATIQRNAAEQYFPVRQLPTFLLFRDRRSVAQQCWISLHSSSNIVGATHAHYAWITKTYGLYSSHDALQVPNLLGVVASVCPPLPTRSQQLPTLLAQKMLAVVAPVCRQPKSAYSEHIRRVHFIITSGYSVLRFVRSTTQARLGLWQPLLQNVNR